MFIYESACCMVHNEGIRHDTTWKISTIDDEDRSLVEETSWVKEDTQKFPNIGWVNIHGKKSHCMQWWHNFVSRWMDSYLGQFGILITKFLWRHSCWSRCRALELSLNVSLTWIAKVPFQSRKEETDQLRSKLFKKGENLLHEETRLSDLQASHQEPSV